MRIDPPSSVPTASGPIPVATATAAPPLDPPQVWPSAHGFRVTPNSALSVTPLWAISGVVVLPTRIAPAARRRATTSASSAGGIRSAKRAAPIVVRTPAVSSVSLTEKARRGAARAARRASPRARPGAHSRAPPPPSPRRRRSVGRSGSRSGPGAPRRPRPATVPCARSHPPAALLATSTALPVPRVPPCRRSRAIFGGARGPVKASAPRLSAARLVATELAA